MRDFVKVSYERLEFPGRRGAPGSSSPSTSTTASRVGRGELTRIKSSVVSRAALAHLGKRLRIAEHLVMGKGMHNQGPCRRRLTANATRGDDRRALRRRRLRPGEGVRAATTSAT